METWLARAGGVVAGISGALFVLALLLADPAQGANIGAGVAVLSAMTAGGGVCLSLIAKHPWARPLRFLLVGAAMLAVVLAALGAYVVFLGALEELSL